MIRRPPRSTLFPTRRSSDLLRVTRQDAKSDFVVVQLRELGDFIRRQLRKSPREIDRKSTRLNSSHGYISYAVFCLKKKKIKWKQQNVCDKQQCLYQITHSQF